MDFSIFDQFKENTTMLGCSHEFVENCGQNICKKCFEIHPCFVTSPMQTVVHCYSPYQRKTHIKSTLTRFVANESFFLPESVLETVVKFSPTSLEQIRTILKEYRLTKYYKHIYSIASHCGLKTASLSQVDYEKIVFHFNRFNQNYSKMNPHKNMIQYSFILKKLFSFIGKDDLIPQLKLTRNKQKLALYETVWNECFT